MSYKVQNETCYDGRSVNSVVGWVMRYLEVDQYTTLVKVKHHDGGHAYQGRFYGHPHRTSYVMDAWGEWKEIRPNVPAKFNHLIVCRIGKPSTYPCSTHVYDRKDSPGTWIVADWKEALVCITAHEAMHLRQMKKNPRGKRGRFNEVETEWAAKRLWEEWQTR